MEKEKRYCYYKTTTKIELPENARWRYWKFHLEDGRWKMFKGIKSVKQLRDLLVKFNPIAFYYSTSEFLPQQMPDKIENPDYQIADQLFMDNRYFVIDIDNKQGHFQVKKSACEVFQVMLEFKEQYEFVRHVLTGTGMRMEYRDLTPRPNLLPNEKEEWLKRKRKEFCLANLNHISNVDDVIAWDTRRVIKAIGSPNPYNEYTTRVLMSPAYFPPIPGKGTSKVNETLDGNGSIPSSLQEQGRAPDGESGYSPSSYPLVFGKFIRNKVEGTKDRFVPYFVYHKKFKHWKEDLLFLQREYGLSTIFVMDDHFKVMCVGVDAVPAPRLNKIYNRSKSSLTKKVWRKYQNLYIRTTSLFNQDLKRIKDYDLKPLFRVSNSQHKLFPISAPHLDFLNWIGFNTKGLIQSKRLKIGKDKNKVYETFWEKRKENGE